MRSMVMTMKQRKFDATQSVLYLGILALVLLSVPSFGFINRPSWNGRGGRRGGTTVSHRHFFPKSSRDGNDCKQPPSPPLENGPVWIDGSKDPDSLALLASRNATKREDFNIRGGSSQGSGNNEAAPGGILSGPKKALRQAENFCKRKFSSISSLFQSKQEKEEEELMQQLKTMPVKGVSIPKSSVLPADVVRTAVKRSGQLGTPLRTDRVQEIARTLKRWYERNGYPLHSVTGASLDPKTGVAELTLQEPRVSRIPVKIIACKQMVVETTTLGDEELLTLKQYKKKYADSPGGMDIKDLNTTFVETKTHTKSSRVAEALNLDQGKHFKWEGDRWQRIARSGIFSRVFQSSPARMPDGTVQLQVIVQEPPLRHLEYGIGKSLYTDSWEGEVDFEHANLFGGGEVIGLSVRRGTKDAEPSIRLKYSDNNFGLEGGYNVELFSEFIGENDDPKDSGVVANTSKQAPMESVAVTDPTVALGYDDDFLLDRKGATIRLQNPIQTSLVRHSVGSASVERTSTRTGLHESIGSTSLSVGPFTKALPFQARSNIMVTGTTGARFVDKEFKPVSKTSGLDVKLLPYSSISMTTRQILPLLSMSQTGTEKPPMVLALSHTAMTSTKNIPRHEANAMSIATQIRGCSPGGRVSTSFKGTMELRVPVSVPKLGGGSAVLFGDWFSCQATSSSPFYSSSSVGVGLRKNVQGFPLKYDVSFSPAKGGKVKALFSLGGDFDV